MSPDRPANAEIQRLRERALAMAHTDEPILLLGETGVGKSRWARELHEASRRRDAPFIELNCAALPDSLIESELFGHSKGAYTGAHRDQHGLIAAADSGTLFLDEIGEMPIALQSKLLQVIESGTFMPIGSPTPRRSDFRLVAASNRDLRRAQEAQEFRPDLYFRISVFVVEIPPLRERLDEVPDLVRAFLAEVDADLRMDPRAVERLLCHNWPGNVRELRNVVRHAALLAPERELRLEDLPDWLLESCPQRAVLENGTWKERVQCFERSLLEARLEQHDGDVDAALRELGISRSSLYRKLRKQRPAPEALQERSSDA